MITKKDIDDMKEFTQPPPSDKTYQLEWNSPNIGWIPIDIIFTDMRSAIAALNAYTAIFSNMELRILTLEKTNEAS